MGLLSLTKKKATTKCTFDGQKGLPLPMPPPDHRTRNEPDSYSRPRDISPRPLHILPQWKQPSSRGDLRVISPQTISVGGNGAAPLSPKMVKVPGADGKEEEKMVSYLKSQKKVVWGRTSLPSDPDLFDHAHNASPRRESTSGRVQTPQSPFSNRRGSNSSALVSPSVANGSAHRSSASANRSVTPPSRSVASVFRAQDCSTGDWRTYRNCDDGNELGSPSSLQFSRIRGGVDSSNPGKASPIQDLKCSTRQKSPLKQLVSSQGRSLHESFQKPWKLPSPPQTPLRLDRQSQTCSSKTATVLQDSGSRPSPNHNREPSPYRYKATPPMSPRQHEQKLTPSAPAALCLHMVTPPGSLRPLKVNFVTHLENQDNMLSPQNSPQPSIISSPCRDFPGNASPLARFLQPVPKPPKRWKRGAKIGSGSFGSVYEGWNLDDGTFFAVKVSNSDHIPPEIHQEVAVLSKLRHPNIVQYYGTTTENGSICIFLELVKMGSLQSIMKNFQVFDEVLMSSYTRQILTGLEYLHSMNTIHRDIKCANILVDSDGQVKLADFGLAKQMKDSLATSVKGSPYYMAPEVLSPGRNKQPYGLEVDIWSLGCTVLEMAEGKPPWSGLQGYAFFFKVTNGELPPIPEHLSDTAKDFITRCLRCNPKDRPTVKELLVHPFVTRAPSTFRASVPFLGQL